MTRSSYNNALCNVVYIVNGKVVETLSYGKPRSIANWEAKKANASSTYKMGRVVTQQQS